MLFEITYKTNIYKNEEDVKPIVKNVPIREIVELNNFNVAEVLNNKGLPYKKRCRLYNEGTNMVIENSYEEIKTLKFSNRIIIKGFRK